MTTTSRGEPALNLRHSIAPRILDNSVPMATLVSNSRFSVRVAPPRPTSQRTSTSKILTTFVWRDLGVRVCLAGSFDDWRKHQMTFVADVGYHILVTELPPGEYTYRFVVDGRWRVAEGDPNLIEDEYGEMSHFLVISADSVEGATPKRFSTASVALAEPDVLGAVQDDVVTDRGESDTESEEEYEYESEEEEEEEEEDDDDDDDHDDDHDDHYEDEEVDPVPPAPEPPQPPLPRHRGDAAYIEDYDDDACGELDLQADVFEAMMDVAEKTDVKEAHTVSPTAHSQSSHTDRKQRRRFRKRPGGRMLRKVWGLLFGDTRDGEENIDPEEEKKQQTPTHNQKIHGLAEHENAMKKGLKVWFPNERNFPIIGNKTRKVPQQEVKEVIDVGEKALKLHQVEDNANTRQMLGKTLFAQGKYDAALALFSLSVKLREDNGLKYAKTTAIAHTDVASAFIHLEDLKNAEKHLKKSLAIFDKGTFSGGRSHLGDVHCFLGVVGDMKGDLKAGESSYRKAIDLYEKNRATDNPNYNTAKENLSANVRRQKIAPKKKPQIIQQKQEPPSTMQSDVSNGHHYPQPGQHSVAPVSPQKATPPPPAAPIPAPSPPPARSNPPQHVPRPLEPSRPAPRIESSALRSPSPSLTNNRDSRAFATLADNQNNIPEENTKPLSNPRHSRKSGRPKTWKALADTARASMPKSPPIEGETTSEDDDDSEPIAGSYEEMCRMWHKDARKLLAKGNYKEAIDLYTLAVYTRKRHGPWRTRQNAETLVEYARALFATKELSESINLLRDAVTILEDLESAKNGLYLGEVWGNLGSVLDRVSGHSQEALTAHCAGMVAYGRAGMSTEDSKWLKAWKSLCISLKMSNTMEKKDEVWKSIDLQIRGVAPLTKVANVKLH